MLYLYIINVMNAALDNKGFILEYRRDIAGMPINVLDLGLILGVLYAIINVAMSSSRMHARTHRAQNVCIVLFVLATFGGAIASSANGAPIRTVLTDIRNFLSFPLCMVLGYSLVNQPRHTRSFVRVTMLSGLAAAMLVLMFFVGKSSETVSKDIDQIRAIQYVGVYTGWTVAVLLFIVLGKYRNKMPLPIALAIIALCFLGQFATLNRSDWLSAMAGIAVVPFILPREGRAMKVAGFVLAVPILLATLLAGTYVVGKVSGRQELSERMTKRLWSMLPGQDEGTARGTKAWDTRVPAMQKELEVWMTNPIIGDGFAFHRVKGREASGVTFHHNVFTSALASTGLLGLAAFLAPMILIMVIGYRMIRTGFDVGYAGLGALGVIAGVYCIVMGMCTMSFNVQRPAMALGFLVGAVFRGRAMQLQQVQDYAGYLDPADVEHYTHGFEVIHPTQSY